MKDKLIKFKYGLSIVIITLFLILSFLGFVLKMDTLLAFTILLIASIGLYVVIFFYEHYYRDNLTSLQGLVGTGALDALNFAQMGILTYNDDYVITWVSDMFKVHRIDRTDKKLLVWLPELKPLMTGEVDEVMISINENTYLVHRKEDRPMLFFKDITKQYNVEQQYMNEQLVIGLIHLDNYEETTQYLDEQEISYINHYIRQPIVDWCKKMGIIVKSLKGNRFFLVLNETIYHQLVEDRFSILNSTRKASRNIEVSITLSMAFARGIGNFNELDEMSNSLLELAQSRGGDQVAMKKDNEEVKYFGGSSEAPEKRSKVRVRIMAHTLKDLVVKSSNVIICGHKEMDADCVAAALIMSNIVASLNKPVSIIAKTGGIEPVIKEVIELYKQELGNKHTFVTESEALNQLKEDTLVIMVDHHNLHTSNGFQVISKAKKVAIFDHHRRKADLEISPILIYIEAGASSSCELCLEFLPYLSTDIEITTSEANIMYLGLLIDTNRFRTRVGSRTFEVASQLKKYGADPVVCDELIKEPFVQFEVKNKLMKHAFVYDRGIIISAVDDNEVYNRTAISQVADTLLSIKDIEAAFIIAKTSEHEVAISSRSNGRVNVQVIMEKMHGGGHLTAAAVQRKNQTVAQLKEELLEVLNVYFKEEHSDESNIIG
ncbi:MAG: DHH family phosphoesterase [Erysipelotrichaceae bacterium]|nr:DHH family phosphoesterase [Erysipelotrichaceae bacterium]